MEPDDLPCQYPERGPSNLLHFSLREGPRLPFTARIERAQFHRARSASKKGTWPLPPHPSQAARYASTEDHQAPSPPLLREQETSMGAALTPFSASKKNGLAATLSPLLPPNPSQQMTRSTVPLRGIVESAHTCYSWGSQRVISPH